MNCILEKMGAKLFQPLPLRTSIIPKHILLDTTSLIYLFCPKGYKQIELKSIIKSKPIVWGSFLNLNHKIFKSKNPKGILL